METLQVFAPLAKLLGMYRIKVSAVDVAYGPIRANFNTVLFFHFISSLFYFAAHAAHVFR
jgi:hypothetical protein